MKLMMLLNVVVKKVEVPPLSLADINWLSLGFEIKVQG